MKKFAIVTGASRGLGSAISHKLLKEDYSLISISRTENSGLQNAAAEQGKDYIHFPCNLADGPDVEHTFLKVLDMLNKAETTEILMVHNAGTVAPIHTVGNLQHLAAAESTQINFISPMLMTNMLLQLTDKKLKIANITSGAAERPIEGWSVYCSTKAALNMFTKTAALEQKTAGTSNTIFAFNPGIMDTDMQGEIRSASEEQFSDITKFKDYKKEGLLKTPDTVAHIFVSLLLSPNTESGEIYHIHDFVK